jgi:hypothetical protein
VSLVTPDPHRDATQGLAPRDGSGAALQGSQASHDASEQLEGHQQIAAHSAFVSLVPGSGIGEEIDDQLASVIGGYVQ